MPIVRLHPIDATEVDGADCNTLTGKEFPMNRFLSRFLKDESGATALEYGLIAASIAVAIIAGATSLGTQLGTTFTNLSTTMQNANGG